MTPQLVDLNADGFQDMVMATFEGTAFLIAGSEEGWAKPVHIKDENDTNVRIAMYYDLEENNYSNVDRSTEDYETNEQHHMTAISVVDWDNDGDLDLILGAHEGGLYRCMNIGTKTEPKFAATNEQIMAGGKPMSLQSLTTPRIVDWDKDGLWDMLLGTVEGEILLHRNVGEKGKPKFEKKATTLLDCQTKLANKIDLPSAVLTGIAGNPYLEAVDYDKDGDLDLIIGAHSNGEQKKDELSEEDKEKLVALKKEMEELNGEMAKLFKDLESSEDYEKVYEDPANKELFEKSEKLYEQIDELEPYFETPHLIWLFRNKAIDHSNQLEKKKRAEKADGGTATYPIPTDFDESKFEVRAAIHDKAADGSATLVVHVNVPKGYHIYGPTNKTIPTELALNETDGVSSAGKASLPKGKMKMSMGERSWWLQNVVTITQPVKISSDAKTVTGHLRYMMCDETKCRPPSNEKFSVTLE